jgi:hypothetical protein
MALELCVLKYEEDEINTRMPVIQARYAPLHRMVPAPQKSSYQALPSGALQSTNQTASNQQPSLNKSLQ